MCTFVTATIDRKITPERLDAALKKFGRHARPLPNAGIASLLPANVDYYWLIKGFCDCGLPFGRPSGLAEHAHEMEREIAKKRRQGWSETKIQRWMNDRNAHGHATSVEARRTAELEEWLALVNHVLSETGAASFGLMHRFYNAKFEDDRFAIGFRERRLRELTIGDFEELASETLLIVNR